MVKPFRLWFLLVCALATSVALTAASDDDDDDGVRVYRVTITNITKAQVFSPPVLATHKSSVGIFELGDVQTKTGPSVSLDSAASPRSKSACRPSSTLSIDGAKG